MEKRINIFGNEGFLVKEFCSDLVKLMNEILINKKNVTIALSGGSTPKKVFKYLASKYRKDVVWNNTEIYWVDERCVAPDDRQSNYGLAKKYLLNKLNLNETNIHRIRGEDEPPAEADRYSKEIYDTVVIEYDLPRFDIILLGIGEDGHTASIFPNKLQLFNSDKICEVTLHPESAQKRITLTGKVLNNAANILFLVSGTAKAEVISIILNKKEGWQDYPAGHINPVHGNLSWYMDTDAAEKIND
jgi:6-phosphogluconolactonase